MGLRVCGWGYTRQGQGRRQASGWRWPVGQAQVTGAFQVYLVYLAPLSPRVSDQRLELRRCLGVLVSACSCPVLMRLFPPGANYWRRVWTLCNDDSMHSLPSLHCHLCLLPAACSFALVALVASCARARLPGWTALSFAEMADGAVAHGAHQVEPFKWDDSIPKLADRRSPFTPLPSLCHARAHSLSPCRFGVSLCVHPCCLRRV